MATVRKCDVEGCEATNTKRSHGIDMCDSCRNLAASDGAKFEIVLPAEAPSP